MDKVAPGLAVGQLGVGIFGEGNGKCIIFLFFFSSKDYVLIQFDSHLALARFSAEIRTQELS